MIVRTIDKEGWIRCGECGHKLFRLVDEDSSFKVETKCHSCKTINTISIGKTDPEKENKKGE